MASPKLTSFAARRQSRLSFVPSKPAQAGLEPRHSAPEGRSVPFGRPGGH